MCHHAYETECSIRSSRKNTNFKNSFALFHFSPPLPSFFHPSPSLSPLPPLLFLSFIASRFSLFVAVVKKSCPFNTRRVTSMKEPAECSRIKRSNCATGYHRLEQSDKKRESKTGTKRARNRSFERSREREISRKFLNTFLDLELKFESCIHFDDETESFFREKKSFKIDLEYI